MHKFLDTTQARADDLSVTAFAQQTRIDEDNARVLSLSRRCLEVAEGLPYPPGCAYRLVTTAFCELDRSNDAAAQVRLLKRADGKRKKRNGAGATVFKTSLKIA